MFGDNGRLRKRLSRDGEEADAEVLAAKKRRFSVAQGGAGGDTWGDRPVYTLKLRVSPEEGEDFEVTITDTPFFAPDVGDTVSVLFDPKHRSKVVLNLSLR